MAFPINAAFVILIIGLIFVANREKSDSNFLRMLASKQMSIISISLFVLACLIIGLFPQNSNANNDTDILGIKDYTSSILFYSVILLMMTHLTAVIFRYKRSRPKVLRFRLNHIGLLIILFGLGLGTADTHRWRAVVHVGETINIAYDTNGQPHSLGYDLRLVNFNAEYYDNGVPSHFAADAEINGKTAHITVNHPYGATWRDDIYLSGYDTTAGTNSDYCILEFIRQPWKYAVMLGVLMMAAGAILMFWGGSKETKDTL